eukprot:COSAG03_NODE_3652_length_1898_cov_3.007782_2_plen_79_part_00
MVVVGCGLAVVVLLIRLKTAIVRVKAPVWSLVKIALGLVQVLALLKDCLNIIYPPGARERERERERERDRISSALPVP